MELAKFKGIIPALLTPFDENDKLNENELKKLIERNIAQGVSGFYVAGSTGEAFLLSMEERKRVMQIVKETAGKRVTLIAHVGCVATAHSVELARYASELGYDAVSSVAPFYYKFGFEDIKKHYFAIADASGLPVIVYNFPAFSGVNITVDQLGELLSDERVIGLKHTSSDYFAMERLRHLFPDKVIYNGYDETYLCGLMMGCDGAIGSTFNFMSDKFIAITNAFKAGDIKLAQALQREANDVLDPLIKTGVMAGEKEVLNQLGFSFGQPRAPFKPVDDNGKELISKIIPLLSK
jgi:N-acetylneuraminate lyase